jgi:hypothetical protein
MCHHQPRCPRWRAFDHRAARIVADQPGQGSSLLCNGVIVFDDGGELLPDGRTVTPQPFGSPPRVVEICRVGPHEACKVMPLREPLKAGLPVPLSPIPPAGLMAVIARRHLGR